MEQVFNLSLKAKQEERKRGLVSTENSMANAETEDEELTFLQHQSRLLSKKPSRKIIFAGPEGSSGAVSTKPKNNNFFIDNGQNASQFE